MMSFFKTFPVILLLSLSLVVNSQDNRSLHADSLLIIDFPDLPKTLWSNVTGIDKPSQMGIFLPKDYSLVKKYPLLLWISGGSGGNGDNPGKARQITKENGFICINLPLYKDSLAPLLPDSSNYWTRLILPHTDSAIIWRCYKEMLDSLFQIIPNINKELTFMGGFSNGAHTTAILIDRPKAEIMNYFKYIFFVEGGSRCQNTFHLKGKPLLIFQGGDSKTNWLKPIYKRALKDKVDVEFVIMKKTGHSFPKKYNKVILKWMDNIIKRNT